MDVVHLPQTGTGQQMHLHGATFLNAFLNKPTHKVLKSFRKHNKKMLVQLQMANKGFAKQMAIMLSDTQHTQFNQIVKRDTTYMDNISQTMIPALDCHVWFNIDGQIDDNVPITMNLQGGKVIYCTEYAPYKEDLQQEMRKYFSKLWKNKRKTLMEHQYDYILEQDTCWMRCGVLYLSDPVKYSLDKLCIGSLGFAYKKKTYWQFG